jgi:hypothetical protein
MRSGRKMCRIKRNCAGSCAGDFRGFPRKSPNVPLCRTFRVRGEAVSSVSSVLSVAALNPHRWTCEAHTPLTPAHMQFVQYPCRSSHPSHLYTPPAGGASARTGQRPSAGRRRGQASRLCYPKFASRYEGGPFAFSQGSLGSLAPNAIRTRGALREGISGRGWGRVGRLRGGSRRLVVRHERSVPRRASIRRAR